MSASLVPCMQKVISSLGLPVSRIVRPSSAGGDAAAVMSYSRPSLARSIRQPVSTPASGQPSTATVSGA